MIGGDKAVVVEHRDASYRHIPGHEGYYARADGTVWSSWSRGGKSAITSSLRQIFGRKHSRSGHIEVRLRCRRQFKLHHLVLMAFVGPRPEGMECRHLNGIPYDNRLSNLVWGTRRENCGDAMKHGTLFGGWTKRRSKT